jgi:hypothetical protein
VTQPLISQPYAYIRLTSRMEELEPAVARLASSHSSKEAISEVAKTEANEHEAEHGTKSWKHVLDRNNVLRGSTQRGMHGRHLIMIGASPATFCPSVLTRLSSWRNYRDGSFFEYWIGALFVFCASCI